MQAGTYRHYKNGKDYKILAVAFDTSTDSKVVVYQALYECKDLAEEYGKNPIFTRPFQMFFENVEHEGQTVPRFKYIGE